MGLCFYVFSVDVAYIRNNAFYQDEGSIILQKEYLHLRLGHLSYKVKKRLEKLVFSHYFTVNHNLK